jgi:serine/threonine protein kinase/tetratricopeptide (TPR) repeat protein
MTNATDTPDQEPNGPSPEPALQPGDTLGTYRIAQTLGESEASILWRAQDTATGADMVIRQLIPGSPAARERMFLERCDREVQKQQALAGQVRRVVLLKELVDDPRGAFLATDFVGGASVGQLLDSRPDPFDLVRGLRIVHATAKVLDQLHENGMIHGGLRPSNIILRLSGGVQVCDVGITALIAEQEALNPTAARYMAPELFHGVAGDARSDIYSLGMIAYEMLAGRGAFEHVFGAVLGDRRSSAMRWMKWHTNARVQPAALHEVNPRVPVRLSDLISRMMAKDRTKRIASAGQLLEAIQRHFGQDAIIKAEASPDAFTPSGAQIKATGPGDTTELPPPNKKPMIIAIAALVVVVLTSGIWLTVSTIKSQDFKQRRALTVDALADADRAYTAGRFDEALSLYEVQSRAWPEDGDALGLHGQAGALLAQAQLDLAAGDYTAARGRLSDLDRMAEAGPSDRQAVKSLTDEVTRREAFEKSIETVRAHLDAGEYAQARNVIRETQRTGLTDTESQTLVDLQVRIDARLESEQVDEALARADELADEGNLAGAINHLTGLKRRLSSPRIDDRIKALALLKDFNEAVERAESAERSGDLDGAVEAFEQALAINEEGDLSARVLSLKSRAAVEKGKALAESGDEVGALASFTTAMGYDPANTEARGWLARMDVTIEKRAQVEAGRRAESSGDLLQAAGHYRGALQHGPDAEVQAALSRVEVGTAVMRAEQLIASGRLEEAGAELDKARNLLPDSPSVTEAVVRHGRHVRYRDMIVRGDGFAERGRFAQAKEAYRDARKVMDTDEVAKRLDDTEFNHLLAQARGYIANEQWASARGILATAAKVRVTDELNTLRERIDRGLKESEQAAEGDDG